MIRYVITEAQLHEDIESEMHGWLARAQERTDGFIAAGKYDESSNIWSDIKRVYLRLQHDKCAYCERQLAAGEDGGTIEHDVEHFRPKNTVPRWPTGNDVSFSFGTGEPLENGYFWLAYHPLNYCTSCKKCNTPQKKNFFPIAQNRGSVTDDPASLNASEGPLLIYPIGDLDEDPETLIEFVGPLPKPAKKNGPRWRRAKVTIKFFKLDTREELIRERCERLVALDNALKIVDSALPDADKEVAKDDIRRLQEPKSPHANCVRSACRMYVETPDAMRDVFAAARDFLDSE
ncbi:MAG: hypothetical protein KDA63_11430 [Planctomycetales bacterium]|nr:hypothetical protein [Planctomycetales bacterium]